MSNLKTELINSTTPQFAIDLCCTNAIALLVTSEYEGIFRNGGIGTYYATLSQKLAEQGCSVVLLLCQTVDRFEGRSTIPHIRHIFSTADADVSLKLSPIHTAILSQFQPGQWVESDSYRALMFAQALHERYPQVPLYIEFPDLCGLGYRTIQAKRTRLLGQNCIVAVTLHSGQEWLNEAHERFTLEHSNWFRTVYEYEQYAFEKADLAFFLSYFLKSKVESYGWKTDHAVYLPYCFPLIGATEPSTPSTHPAAVEVKRGCIPIVFFGRLEERKGLLTFLAAVCKIAPELRFRLHLIFLGKSVPLHRPHLQSVTSQDYIEGELGQSFSYSILTHLFSQEAIALVQNLAPAIVCLASPQENLPNSAFEMGQLPVSLVVSDTGGFREPLNLIQRSAGLYWFEPGSAASLVEALSKAISAYPETPSLPQREFLEQVNHSLLNQRLEYMKQAFSGSSTRSDLGSQEDVSDSFLLGMTSFQEQIFLKDYGENQYSGQGEIIDLGCWLGSATISLAKGVQKNPKVMVKNKRIHAYDLFIWYPYMDAAVQGTSLEGKYKEGDSFLDEFVHRISPSKHLIQIYPGDVKKIGWNPRPIEYLFVDAMKSWELTKSIFINFYPHLILGKSLVHYNDFAHFYESWIHLLIYRLKPYFKHHCNLWQAAVFQYIKPLPLDILMLELDTPFNQIFSNGDIDKAFDYSFEIVTENLRPNIASAKVMTFIHLGDLERAKRELLQARKTFGNILDIPQVSERLSRITGENI